MWLLPLLHHHQWNLTLCVSDNKGSYTCSFLCWSLERYLLECEFVVFHIQLQSYHPHLQGSSFWGSQSGLWNLKKSLWYLPGSSQRKEELVLFISGPTGSLVVSSEEFSSNNEICTDSREALVLWLPWTPKRKKEIDPAYVSVPGRTSWPLGSEWVLRTCTCAWTSPETDRDVSFASGLI